MCGVLFCMALAACHTHSRAAAHICQLSKPSHVVCTFQAEHFVNSRDNLLGFSADVQLSFIFVKTRFYVNI